MEKQAGWELIAHMKRMALNKRKEICSETVKKIMEQITLYL